MSARKLVGALFAALAIWALFAVLHAPKQVAERRVFVSSEQCRECHASAFAEWSDSWHARAWSDPEVLALSNDFHNADCIDCHASRPIFESGIGKRVLPRASRQAEGIDCIACHALAADDPSGALVAGTKDAPRAACRAKATPDLLRPEACSGCHDQHKTVTQWKSTDYPSRNVDCIACHMKARAGAEPGHDHRFLGGHDLELVKSAIELRTKKSASGWTIEIENVGAGHNFPTDERSRAADLFWRPLAVDGASAEPWRFLFRFRSPYRQEVDLEDTTLAAHAVKSIALDAPEAKTSKLEVALFFKTKPYWLDPAHPDPEHEARLLDRVELTP